MQTATRRRGKRRFPWIILIIVVTLTSLEIVGRLSDASIFLENLQLSVRDIPIQLRGPRESTAPIVIVAIDDFSFDWTGYQWPWPRSYFAEIVDKLSQYGAKVIGLDVFFFEHEKDPAGDLKLTKALMEAPNTVTVSQIYRGEYTETLKLPIPPVREAVNAFGFSEVIRDHDAIVRSIKAYDHIDDKIYFNWVFEIAREYLDAPPPQMANQRKITFNNGEIPLAAGPNQTGALLVNYVSGPGSFPIYSAAQVVLGDIPPESFKDKIVLIGATTVTLQDVYPTSFSPSQLTPGVEIVANAIDTILSGKFIQLPPPWVSLFLIVFFAFIAWLINRHPRPTVSIYILGGVMFTYLLVWFLAFFFFGWQIPVITPQLTLFLGVVLPELEQAIIQELEKRRVRALFSRFISPEMVDKLIDSEDIRTLNKRSNVTVLFSDIRGFTSLSEKLSPDKVVDLLNPYLEVMTEIIHKYQGTVDKYEGDAILAFFGEPIPYSDHAIRATRVAIEMRFALIKLRNRWKETGEYKGSFEIGIGLNTGEVFVGMLGSEQRLNYTIIGDNVNLAARLQDLTKEYQWPLLVSGETYADICDEFDAEFIESRLVKGKTEPVKIYKVLGRKGAPDSERISPLYKDN